MAVIEALVMQLVEVGLPTSQHSITQTVTQLFEAKGIPSPLCCTAKALSWYQDFQLAHTTRLPKQQSDEQLVLPTGDQIRDWLSKLRIDMIKFQGVPGKRVYYMQELNFFLDRYTREIKFHRMFPREAAQRSGEKNTVSVLMIMSADGEMGPGMILLPRMVIPEKLFASLRSTPGGQDWVLGSSPDGWLYSDCVVEFFNDVFVPWLKKKQLHFPVALFTSEQVSDFLMSDLSETLLMQGIHLVNIPRRIAPLLSPAEWLVVDYFRCCWGKAVHLWSSTNDSKPLLEENFAPFLIHYLTAQAQPEKVKDRFSGPGIYPFEYQTMFSFLLNQLSVRTISSSNTTTRSSISYSAAETL